MIAGNVVVLLKLITKENKEYTITQRFLCVIFLDYKLN